MERPPAENPDYEIQASYQQAPLDPKQYSLTQQGGNPQMTYSQEVSVHGVPVYSSQQPVGYAPPPPQPYGGYNQGGYYVNPEVVHTSCLICGLTVLPVSGGVWFCAFLTNLILQWIFPCCGLAVAAMLCSDPAYSGTKTTYFLICVFATLLYWVLSAAVIGLLVLFVSLWFNLAFLLLVCMSPHSGK